jgi:hypothetical protein
MEDPTNRQRLIASMEWVRGKANDITRSQAGKTAIGNIVPANNADNLVKNQLMGSPLLTKISMLQEISPSIRKTSTVRLMIIIAPSQFALGNLSPNIIIPKTYARRTRNVSKRNGHRA